MRRKKLLLKVRYRKPGKVFGTKFILSGNHKGGSSRGRVLSVRKVGFEELFKVGDHNPLPRALMDEFNREVIHHGT